MSLVSGCTSSSYATSVGDPFGGSSHFYSHTSASTPPVAAAVASVTSACVSSPTAVDYVGQHLFSPPSWTWQSGSQVNAGLGGGGGAVLAEFNSPPLSSYSGGSPYGSPCHYGGGGGGGGEYVPNHQPSAGDYVQMQFGGHGHGHGQNTISHSHGASVSVSAYAGDGVELNAPPRVRVVKRRNTANKKVNYTKVSLSILFSFLLTYE